MHWQSGLNQVALVKQATECLVLSDQDLATIVDTLEHELRDAISLEDSVVDSLHVYPTYIDQVPNGYEKGMYLALDLGGTNFRVLLIQLKGNRQSTVFTCTYSVSQDLMQGASEHLFGYIAQSVFNFVKDHHLLNHKLMLGFTFSFPCRQLSRKQALLTKWTKGYSCANAVGREVGDMLREALGKYDNLHVEVAAIVNDTTGTLISCAYQEPDCRIGVIVGTGVNLCYMESNSLGKPMIINTELGAFGSRNKCLDFVRTEWDNQVDKQSINHGQQVFEKMVSGMYLGEIVRTIVLNLMSREILSPRVFGLFAQPNSFATSLISKAELDAINSSTWENTMAVFQTLNISEASRYDCECLHIICTRVSRRSAHLTSAVITSLLRRMGHSKTVIGVDGSVYRCHPHYKTVLNEKISQLLRNMNLEHLNFDLMLSEDGSGRGAALIAALPLDVSQLTMSQCTECQEPHSGMSGQMKTCRVCAVTV